MYTYRIVVVSKVNVTRGGKKTRMWSDLSINPCSVNTAKCERYQFTEGSLSHLDPSVTNMHEKTVIKNMYFYYYMHFFN